VCFVIWNYHQLKQVHSLYHLRIYSYPIVKGHSLIAPIRHVDSFFDLAPTEQKACFILLRDTKLLADKDRSVTGFNIGVNEGIDAGQTILHYHIHLIPRRCVSFLDFIKKIPESEP
jgi:diadenosine tetraphosphate (Ap4A) HIT family hydrolase